MARAVILHGIEDEERQRFRNEIKSLVRFLRDKAKITDVISSAIDLPADMFRIKLEEFVFFGRTDEPLLLVYSGHGGDGYWSAAAKETDFSYKQLARIVKKYPAPVLIINDCCNASSIIRVFKENNVPEARVGVISATDRLGWSYGHTFLPEIIKKWQRRISYPEQTLHDPLEDSLDYLPEFGMVQDEPRWRKWIAWFARLQCNISIRLMYAVIRLIFPKKYNASYSHRWGATLDYYFYAKPRDSSFAP